MPLDNNFIVSVADVFAFDPNTNDLLFVTKTNTTTSIDIEMSNTDVRGGFGNQKLLEYFHTRNMSVDLNAATWEKQWLATTVGTTIATQSENVIKEECHTLSSGNGTLDDDPVGDIYVKKPDGNTVRITPTGRDFTVSGLTNEKVSVTYFRSATAERININADTTPQVLRLILKVPQFNSAGVNGSIEIEIPRYQVNGAFTIELTADGVQSSNLSGMALAFDVDGGTDTCDISAYAIVRIIPETATDITYSSIVGLVGDSNSVDIPEAGGTAQINVIGIRGGLFANVPISSSLTYAMEGTSDPDITVNSSGLITVAGSATSGDAGTVIITYTGQSPNLTAQVNVDVTA